MNWQSIKTTCALLFDFDIAGFDSWLETLDDSPARQELQRRRDKLVERLSAGNAIKYNAADDDSQPALKRDAEFIKAQWARMRENAVLVPLARQGKAYSDTQSNKARQRWAEHGEISDDIKRLAKRHRDETPGELWPHLYAILDNMMLGPEEIGTGTNKAYEYDGGRITYATFRKAVRRARK